MVVTTAWGLAVALAVYSVGRISGAHINPAVTLGLASTGAFEWALVPRYLAGQLLGAFLGAVVVWLTYHPYFEATEDAEAIRGVFCTSPAIRSTPWALVAEFVGTVVLLFVFLTTNRKLSRWEGWILIATYVAYVVWAWVQG